MCVVTLSYNENNKVAAEKLAALLRTGLFEQLNAPEEMDIDYSDNSLFEIDEMEMPLEKENYTPEELRMLLIGDLKEIYGVKDAI